jgi:hypothetical protein
VYAYVSLTPRVLGGSDHPNHSVLARRLQAYLAWRNANARHPDVLAARAASAPASAANASNAGAARNPDPRPHDQPGERFVVTRASPA